ncbi:sialidase [Arachidicoccus ginsenosidimutans]|uniref:discoidin domain-containing protein n=1 Tax=Arachidicoccus sp. BS20 TaxID=1850526 RepID=UPI0007F0791B|nr:discoidin domain-containing protein [Arachidicoccus sp. BS20]ANI89662.1 sialidase [Arachidicoccus sp. BS20]
MKLQYRLLFCLLILFSACSKDNIKSVLPADNISIQASSGTDTLVTAMPVLKDSVIVVGLKAKLSGGTSTGDHWITFAVDTTKVSDYNSTYGNGTLLPSNAYLFYKPMCHIVAGSDMSDSVQINIIQESKLDGYIDYVVPIVIQSIDGNVQDIAKEQVFYVVFKAGKPTFIRKTKWTIAGVSSSYSTYVATNILDDNPATYWTSNITQSMPQWIAINFNQEISFSAVTYRLPTSLYYPNYGGYPTSIKIETSMDGTNWIDNGTFAGDISNNMQTLNTGEVTANYLRFTSLSCVPYASAYNAIFISEIGLVP